MNGPQLPRGAKGDAPAYFDDPEVGKVLAMVVEAQGHNKKAEPRLVS